MRVDSIGPLARVAAAQNAARTGAEEAAIVRQTANEENDLAAKAASQLTQAEKNVLPISEKAMLDAIEKANKSVNGASTRFEFSIHEKTKQIMVKVIDAESNEIIRQIPPEKILDMIAGIWDAVGLFVDERR